MFVDIFNFFFFTFSECQFCTNVLIYRWTTSHVFILLLIILIYWLNAHKRHLEPLSWFVRISVARIFIRLKGYGTLWIIFVFYLSNFFALFHRVQCLCRYSLWYWSFSLFYSYWLSLGSSNSLSEAWLCILFLSLSFFWLYWFVSFRFSLLFLLNL